MDSQTLDHLRSWVGRREQVDDLIAPSRVAALAATLDRDDPAPLPGDALPPPWHWTLCVAAARQSALGPDGHPARGGFLPPVPLPRRMWAGGRLTFPQPLRVGEAVQRRSQVLSVDHKSGRSGDLVFVLVRHEFHGAHGLAVTEEHDIVYRELPSAVSDSVCRGFRFAGRQAPTLAAAPASCAWQREIVPDDVLLFRYSALTFNGHRIHYDRRYVTEVEGYPGLVVHGPLIATLLLDLLRRNLPGAAIAAFEFKAHKPLFDIAPFSVHGQPEGDGKTVRLWATDAEGWLAMSASASLA
ncbi:MaoC family dehydratase N-terminal domain-containing protein [Sulfuritalea sp.]|uniref:FAS1-like dehydratase domain-containing protein n=1 Tax=Sulfuritalea sp. TaxID=2480090 RepID=UPI00286E59B5|nr:MaoC family dehydratase N-terminal domain-containing protein [Sulfuritalea sp.]